VVVFVRGENELDKFGVRCVSCSLLYRLSITQFDEMNSINSLLSLLLGYLLPDSVAEGEEL